MGSIASRFIFVSSGLTALFGNGFVWADVPIITLREQFQLAREFDPQYVNARLSQEATEQGLIGSRAGLLPQVTLSASSSRSDRKEETSSFFGPIEVDRKINSRIAQVQARQPIYRRRALMDVEQSQAELESARSALLAAEQELLVRLLTAWLDILSAREQIQIQNRLVAATREAFTEIESKRKSGESTIQESQIFRARMITAEAALADARAQLDIAEQNLKNIAGPRSDVPNSASLLSLNRLKIEVRDPSSISELIVRNNHEIVSAFFQEEAARYEREKVSSDRYPTLDAYAVLSKGDNDAVSSIKDERRVGLQFSLPLDTSGALGAAVSEADANYRKAQTRTRAINLRVGSDALSANSRLRALAHRLSAAQQSVDAYQIMVKAMEMGVKSGVNTRAEVSSALQELAAAQRQIVTLSVDYLNAWLIIEKSIAAMSLEKLEQLEFLSKLER